MLYTATFYTFISRVMAADTETQAFLLLTRGFCLKIILVLVCSSLQRMVFGTLGSS